MHVALPRLRPDHEPHALEGGVEDALVELGRHGDALERVAVAAAWIGADFVFAHVHDVLPALVARAFAHGAHGVGVSGDGVVIGDGVEVATLGGGVAVVVVIVVGGAVVVVGGGAGGGGGVGGVVPGGDLGVGRRDAGRPGLFGRSDEGGGGAEDGVEAGVDVGFDVDGVGGGAGVDEGDEDAEAGAEHGGAGSAELGGGAAGVGEGALALLGEGDDFGEEDDVLAVELHAGGVDLEAVVVAGQAGVEGFHGVHFPFLAGASGGTLGFQGVFGAAEGGALVEGLEVLLVEVCEGVVDFAGGLFVLVDGVDGETEGDDFDGHEAGNEP